MNARIPGYSGFVPSARAEDVYGHTAAATGRVAAAEAARRRRQSPASTTLSQQVNIPAPASAGSDFRVMDLRGAEATDAGGPLGQTRLPPPEAVPDEHPLGRSRCGITRNHWVPTIPGYSGHIPAKHGESIIGGGITHTCRMAGRAIAERGPQLSSLGGYDRQESSGVDADARLAASIRDHCSSKIPGYTGHIPRIKGESIYGSTPSKLNIIAADYCEDRILNPEDHSTRCAAPQVPYH